MDVTAVIPAKAGIQAIGLRDQVRRCCASFEPSSRIVGVDDEIIRLDSGFRRNDGEWRDRFVSRALLTLVTKDDRIAGWSFQLWLKN